MKKFLNTYGIIAALLLGGMSQTVGCSDSEKVIPEAPAPESNLVVVLIDEAYTLDYAGSMTIRGLHFAEGDAVFFKQGDKATAAAADKEYPVTIAAITPTDITVTVTPEIVTGEWSLYCRRGKETQYLGTTQLDVDIFRLVRDVEMAAAYRLDKGDRMTLAGRGFLEGDRIGFSQSGAEATYEATIVEVTDASVTFKIDDNIVSGEWTVACLRGTDTQVLGTTTLTVSNFPSIDPATLPQGTNAYGRITCGEQALKDVYVSDGVEIVQTDVQGVYAMISARTNETLFVTLPAGYEAPAAGAIPQFYALFEEGRDRYDFDLVAADQSSYVLLATADIQIDNDTRLVVPQSSLMSCNNSFVPAYRETINSLAGRKIYGVSLGDMVYDKFWYTRRFALPEYKQLVGQFGVPSFHIMGNHDNDPYCAGDFAAEGAYRRELGPTYYSLNIGAVHYIALDNIVYINSGASEGIVGETNFRVQLTDRQLAWLKKDLATVDKSTPVVVWMHAPLTNCRILAPTANTSFDNVAAVTACFDGFDNVLVLSGHWHNYHTATYPGKANIMEHNLGSVCGALWYNVKGFNGDNQQFGSATDGAPQGFGIYEIDGKEIRWRYRGCDVPAEVQFKAYDMNTLTIKDKTVANEILVNVWAWDTSWKVEVLENGSVLPVTRQMRKDPDYLRYIQERYLPSGESPSKGAGSAQATPHIFSAVTASATSPVQIKVTDRFGTVYTKQLRE